MMGNIDNFNTALKDFVAQNGFGNITTDYTNATYVVGDFTNSLIAAYEDVNAASNHYKSTGSLIAFEDGSKVYQGVNGEYSLRNNNCMHRSYYALGKGGLADGSNLFSYFAATGITAKAGDYAQPNKAIETFAQAFMNSSFSKFNAKKSIVNYANLYDAGSEWAKVYRKGQYARAVRGY